MLLAVMLASPAQAQQPPSPPAEPAPAGEDITQQCVDAHLATQQLRKASKLIAAKEQMLICVQEGCPPPIKTDCAEWLGQIESQIPSVVIAAKDSEGKDATDVRVSIDGVKVADRIDGVAVTVDPGPHEITCEYRGATQVEKVVILQAQKSRQITCSFAASEESVEDPDPTPADGPAADDAQPVIGYVLGVLGLGGIAAFAALGIIGKGEADDLDTSCGKNAPPPNTQTCTDEQIDPVRNKLIAADVSLGVGIGLLAVSMGLILHHFLSAPDPDDGTTAVRVDVGPTEGEGHLPGGAAAQVTVRF